MNKEKMSMLVEEANKNLKGVVTNTPLEFNKRLSEKYKAEVYLKREDLQVVRSYKLRGAFNKMVLLDNSQKLKGIVCASAGNHAQGVAFSCEKLKIKGHIYMPKNTPKQKVDRVKVFGGKWVTVVLVGETFDEAYVFAKKFCKNEKKIFVHPFDDYEVMAGQGTVGLEVLGQLKELNKKPDYFVVPVGGGGLLAGLGSYTKLKNPKVKLIGVEPEGAPSMTKALKAGEVVTLGELDKFVDGAAVKTVGGNTFKLAKDLLDQMLLVPEGKVCEEMISLYQSDGVITEPAGALSVSALDFLKDEIKGKVVVCVISGGNNDMCRYPEIMDRSLVYRGLKHYFIVEFSQKPGALRNYLDNVLGKDDDITLFEYIKKSNKETGPALVGIELAKREDFESLLNRMNYFGLKYEILKKDSTFFRFLI
jgi:threonine dehydratase